ncbi:hypothetical protein N0V84_005887 [Fusarium piperis]|uniref:2EXR domain-containing protein n=1 Tax=Fusarium piperis TaxID=1435070 RepID=A0A9W9BQ60_9HYPO|nr:hypothetical protein N0V84_005887 [Fusarium piperis]
MNNTFQRFPCLPPELRDQIWKFALRNSIPGVHVFKIYNAVLDNGVDNNIDVMSGYESHDCQRLAAPDRKENSSTGSQNTDGTQNLDNPSTYLIDGGVWTACRESRYAAQRHFGLFKWRSLYEKDPERFQHMSTREKLDMPATGCFASKDPYSFAVFPNRDLFIFRPHDIRTIGPRDPSQYACIGAHWQGFRGFQHIALEYDREWADKLHDVFSPELDDVIRSIVRLGYHTAGDKLWFIDYTLKRRHEAAVESSPSENRERATFYMEGKRFVEVDCSANSLENWECTERVNGVQVEKASALESMSFVRKVQCVLMEFYADLELLDYGLPRRVGLLACESLSP